MRDKKYYKISYYESSGDMEIREVSTMNGFKKNSLYYSANIFMFVDEISSGIVRFKTKYLKNLVEKEKKINDAIPKMR